MGMRMNNRGFGLRKTEDLFQSKNDKLMDKDTGLYPKLTTLFKRGINKRFVADPKRLDAPTRQDHQKILDSQFQKATYNHYLQSTSLEVDRLKVYEDYLVMDYCLAGDTKIATPDGFITIEDLASRGKDNEFVVYSYDHNKKQLVPAMARNAHQTQVAMTYKVVFDDGSEIIGTPNHKLMMRDGSFKRIDELGAGDSMMPFYRKDTFYPQRNYNFIYTCNSEVGYNGWVSEHKLIAEWKYGRKLEENEVVHHVDFCGKNNDPDNLLIMDKTEHKRYHCEIIGKNNWKNPLTREKMLEAVKINGSKGAKVSGDKNIGRDNPSYIHIPFDDIIEAAKINRTLKGTAKYLGVSYATIQKKTRDAGYMDWKTFCFAYGIELSKYSTAKYENGAPSQSPENRKRNQPNVWNHKVVEVVPHKEIPVYDFTVPGYKNFATDTVISHNTPEISSALDIYADESLTQNEEEKILDIECENYRVKSVLENLFYDILDIDHNLWYWMRNMCKFGNHFILLDVQPRRGVVGFLPLPVREIRREEAYDGNVNSVKFIWDAQNEQFDSWQIAHFRLLDNMDRYPYGTSALESARLIWKQLTLAEDAMMLYRISRAPERRVFYIDVGNIDPGDVPDYIKKIKNQITRQNAVNEKTGTIDKRYNSMAIDEDFYIPRRNDKNSEVDTLPGASNLDEIADIEYMQNKLFAALKVPKAFLTFEEEINAKATLASEDFRFARTINRFQQAAIATLTNIAITHLWALGLRDKDHLTEFDLKLTNPSTQTEIEKMEIYEQKASVFTSMWDESTMSPISYVWGMKNIFNFSDDEIKVILKQQFLEGKMKMEIENVSMPQDDAMGGMGMETGLEDQGGGGGFETPDGQDLPPEPPEGVEYVNPETGETVEENLDRLMATMKELSLAHDSRTKKKPTSDNKRLLVNSLSYDSTLKMLESLDEKLESGEKIEINYSRSETNE